MKNTAVEWLEEQLNSYGNMTFNEFLTLGQYDIKKQELFEQAKEMEKQNIDNKVIHFAEWLTKKHSYTLMALYEHFEEEHYK